MNPHRRRRRRRLQTSKYRRNPRTRTVYRSGGGSSNLMLYLAIGGAAYFLLLRPGGLSSLFGGGTGPAVAGYTPLGGNYYRNAATGQTVYRNPTTGQMTTATGAIAPSGVPAWLQPTVQAGAVAIPQLGIGIVQGITGALSSGIRSLFGDTSVMGTPVSTTELPSGATSVSAPDILRDGGGYGLPTLPSDLAIPAPSMDWAQWFGGGIAQPGIEPAPSDLFAAEIPSYQLPTLSLAPVDTSGWFAGDTTDAGWW